MAGEKAEPMDAAPQHSPQQPARVRHPMVEANIGESPRGSRPKVFARPRSSEGARATPRHLDRAFPTVAFALRRSSSPRAAPVRPSRRARCLLCHAPSDRSPKFLIQTNSEILPARLAFPESQRGIAPSSTRSSRTSPTCRPDGTLRASSTSSRRSAATLATRATTSTDESPTRTTPSGASRGNRGFSTRRRASARRSYCSGWGDGPS